MTKVAFNSVAVRLMPDLESPLDASVVGKSGFFSTAFSMNLATVVVPAAEEINTDACGQLWADILPTNGGYTIDLATVLPYYLPAFDGKPEAVVIVHGSELVLSSRMARCFYSETGKTTDEFQYYLCHFLGIPQLKAQRQFTSFHPLPLRSFVAKRLFCLGESARAIIQEHFPGWIQAFVREISLLIDAVRAASPSDAKHLLPQFSTPALPIFWVGVQGENDKRGVVQFGGDVPAAAFRALTNLGPDAVERVHQYLAADSHPSIHDAALALAHTFHHYGYLDLALLQVCIACESVLADHYRAFLLSRGVSKTKYDDQKRDITFSQLLNLHLAAVADLSALPNREVVLGCIDWARRCRNDAVHEGKIKQPVSEAQVKEAIVAAEGLIAFLLKPVPSAIRAT
jgi:hypothetical protein